MNSPARTQNIWKGILGVPHEEDFTNSPACPTIREAVPAYLSFLRSYRKASSHTVRGYATSLRLFAQWLALAGVAETPLNALTRGQVAGFAFSLRGNARTIAYRLQAVSSLYGWLIDQDLAESNPVRRLPLPRPEQPPEVRVATPEEIDALLAVARQPWHRVALLLLARCGLRRSEIGHLRVGDFNVTERTLRVLGKGRRIREAVLSEEVNEAVWRYLAGRKCEREDPLLLTQRRTPVTGATVWEMLSLLAERAGLRHLNPHSFRHQFASRLVENGADLAVVRDLMGHASLSTTSRYTHSSRERQRAAVEALSLRGGDDGTKPTK